jgi:hypothetical protein
MNTQTAQRGNVATLPPPNPNLPATVDPSKVARAPEGPPPTSYPVPLATALLAVTEAIGKVPKATFNEFHKYHYQSWEDVLSKLSPLLTKHGIIIQQSQIGASLFENDQLMSITYEFTIIHAASGEVWPDRLVWTGVARLRDQKNVYDDKAANKCHTAAHKYFCLHFFKIRTKDTITDDADAGPPKPPANPMQTKKDLFAHGKTAAQFVHSLLELVGNAPTLAELDEIESINATGLDKLEEASPHEYDDAVREIERKRGELTEAAERKEAPQAEAHPDKPASKAATPPPNPFAAKPKPEPATEAKPDPSQGDGLDIPEIFRRHRPEVEAILAKLKATTTWAETEQFIKDQHDAIAACSLQETKDIQAIFMQHRAALVAKQGK